MAQEYWYNSGTTKTALKALNDDYKAIITAGLNVGKTLKQYVCVSKKWNDENAVTFADWWNQNGKGGGAGGNLKWDATNKLLYMSKQTGSQADGEDKIRHVVSMCACVYWLITCNGFSALSSSFSKEMKQYDAYLKAAKNTTYKNKFNKKDYSGTTWMTMMSNNFGAKKWSNTKLPTKPSGSVTSATEVKKLADALAKNLTDLNSKVDSFCEEVNRIVGNTNTNKYWGFSDDLYGQITSTVRQLNKNTVTWLKSFASNTNTALATANNVVSKDLASLSKIKFS